MGWNNNDIRSKPASQAYREGWEAIDWGNPLKREAEKLRQIRQNQSRVTSEQAREQTRRIRETIDRARKRMATYSPEKLSELEAFARKKIAG